MIAAESLPVDVACRVLGVSVSGYYEWRNRSPSPRSLRHAWLTELIMRLHVESRGVYGIRRVHAELTLGHGISVGREAVGRLMRRAGLQGITGRPRYRRVPNVATAEDRVRRQFDRDGRDQLWVTDITEHRTREGKVYCAVVLDTFSRRVVGWSIDSQPAASLVTNALGMAIEQRDPQDGATVIHSDQGTQFTSWAFTRRAVDSGLLPSRELLRQCDHRVVLEPHAGRASRSSAMEDARRARQRDLRVPRDLPQSTAAALLAWHALTRGVRTTERIMKGCESSYSSPEKPGHTISE